MIALSSRLHDDDTKYTQRIDMRVSSQPLNIRHIATSFPNHVPVTCQYAMILTRRSPILRRSSILRRSPILKKSLAPKSILRIPRIPRTALKLLETIELQSKQLFFLMFLMKKYAKNLRFQSDKFNMQSIHVLPLKRSNVAKSY